MSEESSANVDTEAAKPRSKVLTALSKIYVQVFIALILGVIAGFAFPDFGATLQPLGNAFIALIKMIVGPIVFCVIVLGIASSGSAKSVGRVGVKALIYFEILSVIALAIGTAFALLFKPGEGMGVDPASLDTESASQYTANPVEGGVVGFFLNIIPPNPVAALADGDILQILFFSLLFGIALLLLGRRYTPVVNGIQLLSDVLFKIMGFIMRTAPIGVFGAMAFTIGAYGIGTLRQLGLLLIVFWSACIFFLVFVVGVIAATCKVNFLKLIRYFKEEILIVLGTESTEAVMPQCMQKLKNMGISRGVVSLTFPAGYSFNMDGATIYLAMGALFIAQATDTHLSWGQILMILAVGFVTSHGSAGVAGAVFFILVATLDAVGTVPVAGVALLIGIDRIMNELRAVTNLIGNIVASIFVARWENAIDYEKLSEALSAKKPKKAKSAVKA